MVGADMVPSGRDDPRHRQDDHCIVGIIHGHREWTRRAGDTSTMVGQIGRRTHLVDDGEDRVSLDSIDDRQIGCRF